MSDPQTVTANVYHPYPAYYWEFKLTDGSWDDIVNYRAYVDPQPDGEGQGTKWVTILPEDGDQALIHCTVGPESAGTPTPAAEGTVTTDDVPVTIGALLWVDDLEDGATKTIQSSQPATDALFGPVRTSDPDAVLTWLFQPSQDNPTNDWYAPGDPEFFSNYEIQSSDQQDNALYLPSVKWSDDGQVKCQAAADAETADSDIATVNLIIDPLDVPVITLPLVDETTETGQAVFNTDATGTGIVDHSKWEAEATPADPSTYTTDLDSVFGAGNAVLTNDYKRLTLSNLTASPQRGIRNTAESIYGRATTEGSVTVMESAGWSHDFTLLGSVPEWNFYSPGGTGLDNNGILRTVGANTPVLVGGEWNSDTSTFVDGPCEGVLCEVKSSNQVTYSETLTFWDTTTAVGATQPDPAAGTNAYRIDTNSNSAVLGLSTFTSDVPIAPSFWIKRVSTTGTQVVTNQGGTGQWSIAMSALPDAWVRMTDDHEAVTVDVPWASVGTSGGFNLNSSSTVFDAYGFQIEDNVAFSSSYIRSDAGTATNRARSYFSIPMAAVGLGVDGFIDNNICAQGVMELQGPAVSGDRLHSTSNRVSDGGAPNSCMEMTIKNSGNGSFQSYKRASGTYRADTANTPAFANLGKGRLIDTRYRSNDSGSTNPGHMMWVKVDDGELLAGIDEPAQTQGFQADPLDWILSGHREDAGQCNKIWKFYRVVDEALTNDEIEAW